MIKYSIVALVSFCLGAFFVGGYDAWQNHRNDQVAEAERLQAERQRRIYLNGLKADRLEREERTKRLAKADSIKATGTVVDEDLLGFKDLFFEMNLDDFRKKGMLCRESILSNAKCEVSAINRLGGASKRYSQTALGHQVVNVSVVFDNSWGPVTTADKIRFAIPVPADTAQGLLQKRFGKPYLNDKRTYGNDYNQAVWIFQNGGALTLFRPAAYSKNATTTLNYWSPRLFQATHPYFIDRFNLAELYVELDDEVRVNDADL